MPEHGGRTKLPLHTGSSAEVCTVDGLIDLDRSVVVAEVYSRAVRPEDEGLIACYFLLHSMDADEAERAMNFFAEQPGLLVDTGALVDDSNAEFPALVTIRWTDETRSLLSTVHQYGILRELPSDDVVRRDGFDLFMAFDALSRGLDAPEAAPLPSYDYRALRRKVYAVRASVVDDRDPWLQHECRQLRRVTEGDPEGCEALVARADDMEAALRGQVDVGNGFSVIIPTTVERQKPVGAIVDWVPQAGREVVIAHGLDGLQAARVLAAVRADREAYVSKAQLLNGSGGRERLGEPFVVRDSGLNWISTDLQGRRSNAGYERLRQAVTQGAGTAPQQDRQSASR